MIKTISFILALFISMAFIPVNISVAQTNMGMSHGEMNHSTMKKRKYRYRQRNHRFQIAGQFIPWNQDNKKNMFLNFNVLYGYNAGYFELGPLFNMSTGGNNQNLFENLEEIAVGLWVEGNFINNKRTEKFIPAIGLKSSFLTEDLTTNSLLSSVYLALKYFPASRTGIIFNIGLDGKTNLNDLFGQIDSGVYISVAYVHYFH